MLYYYFPGSEYFFVCSYKLGAFFQHGQWHYLCPRKREPSSCQRYSPSTTSASVVMQEDKSIRAEERTLYLYLQRRGKFEIQHKIPLWHHTVVRCGEHSACWFSGGLPRANRRPTFFSSWGESCVSKRWHVPESLTVIQRRIWCDGVRITLSAKQVKNNVHPSCIQVSISKILTSPIPLCSVDFHFFTRRWMQSKHFIVWNLWTFLAADLVMIMIFSLI